MEVVHERCAGMDVHKKLLVVCVILAGVRETRKFGTMTAYLGAMRDWLLACGVTHAALGSTGSYWKPCSTSWRAVGSRCWW